MDRVTIGAGPLTIEALEAVARRGAKLAVHPDVIDRVQRSRALVERWVAEGRPVYGITTGFGRCAKWSSRRPTRARSRRTSS